MVVAVVAAKPVVGELWIGYPAGAVVEYEEPVCDKVMAGAAPEPSTAVESDGLPPALTKMTSALTVIDESNVPLLG